MSTPINIMHLRASNFVGGPEKQILEHFGRLNPNRFRPILGTFVDTGAADLLGDEANSRGFHCIRLPAKFPLDPGNILQLVRIIKQEKIDIICSHGYKPNVLGCCAAKLCRIPSISISRGWTWESLKIRLYEAFDRFFLRMADHVVAVSAGQGKKILSCGVPQERISVIHNAINLHNSETVRPTKIKEELGLPEDALLVASAGRLSPEKNYAAMIEVAKKVSCKNSSLYFSIFGEGILRKDLEQQINDARLQGRFFLPGFRPDMQTLYQEIDIFMLPSLTEGLPNVALEAFAAQKPIVASAVGGTPEVVQDGVSGFLAAPDNITGMAENVLKLATDPTLRHEMGMAGYRHVAENFGFEAQTGKYEELYEAIYNRRHPGP